MFGDSQSDDGRYHQRLCLSSYVGIMVSIPSDRTAYRKADGNDRHEVCVVLVMSFYNFYE